MTHNLVVGSPKDEAVAGQVVTQRFVVLSAHRVKQWKGFSTHSLEAVRPQVPFMHVVTQILDEF